MPLILPRHLDSRRKHVVREGLEGVLIWKPRLVPTVAAANNSYLGLSTVTRTRRYHMYGTRILTVSVTDSQVLTDTVCSRTLYGRIRAA